MPFVTDGPDGPQWVTKQGANFGLKNGVGPSGAKLVPGQNKRVDIMAETGLFADGKKDIRRVSDPHLRAQGHGPRRRRRRGDLRHARLRIEDADLPKPRTRCCRIYNDWLVDFCSHYPDRHIGLACLPVWRRRRGGRRNPPLRQDGPARASKLSCSWDMEPMWHPCWEPLWQAVNEVQLPLHFHTFPTTPPRAREMTSGQVRRAAMFTGVSAFQMGLIHILAAMMGAGVFERYPHLRVSFGESGIGWIPYALDRMDFEFEDRFRDLMKLKPSEYWQRQCKATFQFDPIGPKLLGRQQPDDGRYADVGLRLPAHRRDLAGIDEVYRRAVRRACRRRTSTRSPARTRRSSII